MSALPRPFNVTAATVGTGSTTVLPARTRTFLGIYNQSSANTLTFSFGATAAVTNGAGCITLQANSGSNNNWFMEFPRGGQPDGVVPATNINMIASGSSTPVTILE